MFITFDQNLEEDLNLDYYINEDGRILGDNLLRLKDVLMEKMIALRTKMDQYELLLKGVQCRIKEEEHSGEDMIG